MRSCRASWDVLYDNQLVGQVTSAIWSPDFHTNVALGMIDQHCAELAKSGEKTLVVDTPEGCRLIEIQTSSFN